MMGPALGRGARGIALSNTAITFTEERRVGGLSTPLGLSGTNRRIVTP